MDTNMVTADDWRKAMGYFASGVTIVTTMSETGPIGSTVSSFCSVSLEPPLLLVCLAQSNPVLAPALLTGKFGVNILGEQSGAAAMHFANPDKNSDFEATALREIHAAPHLEMAPCFVECAVHDSFVAGDHTIIIGRGLSISQQMDVAALIYHQGKFVTAQANVD